MTLSEKIAVLSRLIDKIRWSKPQPGTEEYYTYEALKEISKDLRGRLDGAPSVTEMELGRRINAARKAKERKAGNLGERLSHIGQEVIAKWPTIQAALAKFDATAEEER